MGCFASARNRQQAVKATTEASQEQQDPQRGNDKFTDVRMLSVPRHTAVLATLHRSLTAACASANLRLTESGDGFCMLVVLCDLDSMAELDAASFQAPEEVFQAEASWKPVITFVSKGAASTEILPSWRSACPILFRRTSIIDADSKAAESEMSGLLQDGLEEARQLAETSPGGRLAICDALPSSRLATARIDLQDLAHVRQTAPRNELDAAAVAVLTGLSASPELNGRLASLGVFDAEKGRYHAQLVGEERVVAVAPDKLEPVGSVLLCGIQKRPELNGHRAVARRCNLETGRIEVEVDNLGETIAVRPEHIQLEFGQKLNQSGQAYQEGEQSPPGSPHGSPPPSPGGSPRDSPASPESPEGCPPSDSPGKSKRDGSKSPKGSKRNSRARSPRGSERKPRRKTRSGAPRDGVKPGEVMNIEQALLILEESADNTQTGEDIWASVELIEKPEGGATVAYLKRLQQTLNGQPNHRILRPRRGCLKGSRGSYQDTSAERQPKRPSVLTRANSARFASAAEEAQRGAALRNVKAQLQDESLSLDVKLPLVERVLSLGEIPAAAGLVAAALTLLVGTNGIGGPLAEGWAGGPAGRGGELLISALRQFQDSEAVQRTGLAAMVGVAAALPAFSAVIAAPLACKALQGFPRSLQIRRSACICLAQLLAAETAGATPPKTGSRESAGNDSEDLHHTTGGSEMWLTKGAVRHAVMRTGIVQVLLHNVHSRKPDLTTVQSALEALAELSTSTRGRDDILKGDGAAIVLRKMRRHQKVRGVQQAGCAVIRQLSAGPDRAAQELLVKHGAIRAASGAIHRFAVSPATAAEALGVLSSLSAKVPEHRQKVVERKNLVTHIIDALRHAAAEAGAGPATLEDSQGSTTAESLPLVAGTEAERQAAASACLAGLAVLHNLTLTVAHREILVQQGALDAVTLCSSSGLPAEVRERAQRLRAALCNEGEGGGGGAFSGLFVARGGPGASTTPSTSHAVSKQQRKRAQKIALEVLGHKAASALAGSRPAQPKRSPRSSSLRRSRRDDDDEKSSALPSPPLEGYGRRGEGGWRIHKENADWLWNDLKGFYFHCATELLFRRFGDGSILEVNAAPPPRHALLSMVACNSQVLQRAIFAVWRDFAREHGERGWQSEGSASGDSDSDAGASFDAESSFDAGSSSSTSSSSEESNSAARGADTQKRLEDAAKSQNHGAEQRAGSATSAFRDIEDFVPAEEGRRLSDALVGGHFGAPASPVV